MPMSPNQMNPAYMLDPSLYGDQQAIDQQRQLAQLLMTQGLTSPGGTESVGGVAIRRSPFEGAGRLAQLLSGQSLQGQANVASQSLMQRQMQALAPMFGLPSPGDQTMGMMSGNGAGGMSSQGGSGARMSGDGSGMTPAPSTQGSPMSVNGASPITNLMSYSADPAAHMKAVMEQYAATPEMKAAGAAYGVGSPQYITALQNEVRKAGYMPPNEIKAGNTATDAITNKPIAYGVKLPEGAQPTFNPDGTMKSAAMVPGVAEAMQAGTEAAGLGKAATTSSVIYDANGNPQFSTELQKLMRAQGWTPPTAMMNGHPQGPEPTKITPASIDEQIRMVTSNGGQPINPADQPALNREVARLTKERDALAAGRPQFTPEQRPGVKTSVEGQQKTLEDRFTQLRDANGQAETTNSYLQNIKQLADKAATGKFADRQQFVNALLSMVGNEKASDSMTANNLLDKYSNQIVARLGQGGLGTDAARSILQSAYPNATMTPDAIKDAADNLMGANAMIQAKMRTLSPIAASRDPVAYQQKEQVFDQNADPRIWQYANIQDPAKRKSFLQSVLKSDPTFLQKAEKLQGIGAL